MQVSDGNGGTRPLVKSERVLFQATRPPEPSQPPSLGMSLLAIGLAVSALILWTGARALSGRRQARLFAAITLGLWSFAAGVLGLVLTLLWTATHHVFAHRNENLLLFNPVWLVLAVLIPLYYARGAANRATRAFALAGAGLAVIALVLHVVTLSSQENWPVIALGLPPALAIAWVATRHAAHLAPSRR
jgi:hypothetical protein